jgi:hypothetical protein
VSHTPGPWIEYAPSIAGEVDPYYREIRSESAGYRGVDGFSIIGFISPSDAKLVAAAPELLEACETLLKFLCKATPYTDAGMWEWKGELVDVERKAREAIKKARGG